ncbi:hypothetical protein GT037_003117 [Alternaria burnsii]|uniref:Uncharacterized protein n=1 Tax=Alternaria burnsii TaxID=1187904 RepID=A0A8H7BD35_9PLEO|nr:uncharacterized protein GT037_003117 [Alternaria burnsii]KAF7679369.1 hypothetical protein GT037_003117 [Alternaria burnsii]
MEMLLKCSSVRKTSLQPYFDIYTCPNPVYHLGRVQKPPSEGHASQTLIVVLFSPSHGVDLMKAIAANEELGVRSTGALGPQKIDRSTTLAFLPQPHFARQLSWPTIDSITTTIHWQL